MIKNKQKGFALVLSLVFLLAMSLMGGGLIVIASSDHQGNNSSDEYQQTFYVAETALMQAEKSLINSMIGPIDIVLVIEIMKTDLYHETRRQVILLLRKLLVI